MFTKEELESEDFSTLDAMFDRGYISSALRSEVELKRIFIPTKDSNTPLIVEAISSNALVEQAYFYFLLTTDSKNRIDNLYSMQHYYEMTYHYYIENFVLEMMVKDSIRFKPILNYILSQIEDVERVIIKVLKELKDSKKDEIEFNEALGITKDYIQTIIANLKRYDSEEYKKYAIEIDSVNKNTSPKKGLMHDRRRSKNFFRTNSEVAYAINHVFGLHINKFSKDDKINLLAEITGRSGSDLYNNYNGLNHLTKDQRDKIEQKLNNYKLK